MEQELTLKIIRSSKRRKTVTARLVNGVMEVLAPARISEQELDRAITGLKERFRKEKIRTELNRNQNLWPIAQELNRKYLEGKALFRSIEYVANQSRIYGCCNIIKQEIRISHVLSFMPAWVRDYVIVHELAHLLEPNHSPSFWNWVHRYPMAERAIGFLLAKGYEGVEPS